MSGRRGPVVVVIASLIALLVVAGRSDRDVEVAAFGRPGQVVAPETDEEGALTSTWYCAAGAAAGDGAADLTLVVANAGPGLRRGTVTWMPSEGEPVVSAIEVDPRGRLGLRATDAVRAPHVSAIVELDGGDVAVEHTLAGSRGHSVAPCASAPSDRWFLANGSTTRDASQRLYLFNPFPDEAIVDITFATDGGRVEPPGLEGLPISAGTTRVVELTEFVRRQEVTATAVIARAGRLVVDRVQGFDGSEGRRGLSLGLAAPAPARVWTFPDGLHDEGVAERWHVFNPGPQEAVVALELVPAEGDSPEPLDLTVPAQSQVTVVASEIERVPAGVAHTSVIRSMNDVPVVAERAVDARAPASRRGWDSMLGSPVESRGWFFPAGEASDRLDEWIVVHNPGAGAATVSIVALAGGQELPIEGLQDLPLDPAGRVAVRLGDHVERAPLPVLVRADRPVVAERTLYTAGAVGITASIGVVRR